MSSSALHWTWRIALAFFILAGVTGALYRFGLIYGFTAGLDLVNIRHAHSHLMYFGWVTPALMALILQQLPAITGRPVGAHAGRVVWATFATALLAYPLFLAYGYTPVEVGGGRLPLSVIAATLNMLVWYAWVWVYTRATRGVPRSRTLLLWDGAALFLVLSTCGAWGVALLQPLGIEDPRWATALTHFFLDLFSEGWFVLALLGLAFAAAETRVRQPEHWSLWLLFAGLPLMFAFGMPASTLTPGLKVLAIAGGTLVGVGLLVNVGHLWRVMGTRRGLWLLPLLLLAFKAIAQIANSLIPGLWWGSQHGFRVLYLHLMLLGFVTLGLLAAFARARNLTSIRGLTGFYGAVLAVLLTLLPMTPLWPVAWVGPWIFFTAAWCSLLPPIAALYLLFADRERASVRTNRSPYL